MNFEETRRLFPIVEKFTYLNAASVTPYYTTLVGTLAKIAADRRDFGSLHFDEWEEEMEETRDLAARLINASPSEIAFVKNTSEGVNLVAGILDWKRGDNVVVSEMDFPTNVYPFLNLKRRGVEVRYIKNIGGGVSPEGVEAKIDDRTRLVSLSHVFYNTGFRIELEKMGTICRENGVLFHVDSAQSTGAIKEDVKRAKVDFLSTCGYKWLLSPFGSGIFYIRKGLIDESPVLGWRSVEDPLDFDVYDYVVTDSAKRFEIGNLDAAAFLGMGVSLELINSIGIEKIERRIIELSSLIVDELEGLNVQLISNFEKKHRSGIVSFKKEGLTKDDLIENNIIATVRDYVRLSPHIYNDEEDISNLIAVLKRLGC